MTQMAGLRIGVMYASLISVVHCGAGSTKFLWTFQQILLVKRVVSYVQILQGDHILQFDM